MVIRRSFRVRVHAIGPLSIGFPSAAAARVGAACAAPRANAFALQLRASTYALSYTARGHLRLCGAAQTLCRGATRHRHLRSCARALALVCPVSGRRGAAQGVSSTASDEVYAGDVCGDVGRDATAYEPDASSDSQPHYRLKGLLGLYAAQWCA